MANPFDQFDNTQTVDQTNPFDQFDAKPQEPVASTGIIDTINPQLKSKDSAIMNTAAAINERIATGLSVPPEVANEVLDMVGLRMFKPGEATKYIKQKFREANINVDPIDTWTKRLGQEGLYAVLGLGAISRGASILASKPGVSATKFIAKEVSDFIQKHPILSAITDQAASAGGVLTHEALGPADTETKKVLYPMAEVAGSMAGGMVGAGIAGKVSRIGGLVGKAGKAGAKAIGGLFGKSAKTTIEEPLVNKNFELQSTPLPQYSEDQLDATVGKLDNAINDAVASAPVKGTSEEAQAQFHSRLMGVRKIARRIESDFWHRVDMKRPVPMSGIKRDVAEMKLELRDKPSTIPTKFMDELKDLSMPVRGPDGKMQKSLPSIERLRDIRNEIRQARLTEQAKDAPYDALIANYNRLESIIDNGIANAYPKDVALQQARNMSIKLHDMFDRSNLGALFARRRSGQFYILPEQSIEKLLPRFKGLQDLTDMTRKMVYLQKPGGKGFAVTKAERDEINMLRSDAENSVRAMFQDQANQFGPEKAAKWFAANEKNIKPLANATADLDFASRKIITNLQYKAMLEKSELSRFTQRDPDIAIKRIFNNPTNPAKASHEFLQTIKGSPEALAAYEKGLIKQFFIQAKFDPLKAKELLGVPRIRDMMQEALRPHAYQRFYNIVNYSYALTQGESKSFVQKLSPVLMLGSRVLGAQSGHIVARLTGGGTIQTASIFSEAAKRTMANLLKWTDPQDLMVNAIVDPKWESVLHNRMFSNVFEMKRSLKLMRRVLGLIEGERQAIMNRYSERNSNGR